MFIQPRIAACVDDALVLRAIIASLPGHFSLILSGRPKANKVVNWQNQTLTVRRPAILFFVFTTPTFRPFVQVSIGRRFHRYRYLTEVRLRWRQWA